MLDELVTDPVCPGRPSVLTVIGPWFNPVQVHTPVAVLPGAALAVTGLKEPPGGSVTAGVGPSVGGSRPPETS